MRKINAIIVHCSATREGQDFRATDIRGWHRAQGWSDIGYHFVINLSGAVEIGRPLAKAGAHAVGFNADSIGICYIGGVDANNFPKDTRTEAQKTAMRKLIDELHNQFPTITKVMGHRDTGAKKACPSFDVKDWYYGNKKVA